MNIKHTPRQLPAEPDRNGRLEHKGDPERHDLLNAHLHASSQKLRDFMTRAHQREMPRDFAKEELAGMDDLSLNTGQARLLITTYQKAVQLGVRTFQWKDTSFALDTDEDWITSADGSIKFTLGTDDYVLCSKRMPEQYVQEIIDALRQESDAAATKRGQEEWSGL